MGKTSRRRTSQRASAYAGSHAAKVGFAVNSQNSRRSRLRIALRAADAAAAAGDTAEVSSRLAAAGAALVARYGRFTRVRALEQAVGAAGAARGAERGLDLDGLDDDAHATLAMIAVRDQEVAASTVGINVARVKVGTFALSAAYAGIAGALSVMIDRAADATNPLLAFRNSIEFLVAVVIGGTATITGPAVGALILVLLRRHTDGLIEGKEVLSPAIFGGALILMMFVLPSGVVGGLRKLVDRVLPPDRGPGVAVAGAVDDPDPLPTQPSKEERP